MRRRSALLGLAIGIALADSSIVTLALPDVLREFDVSITTVAWVLTSYNLVLAVLAVPAAYVARRNPAAVFAAGTALFAAASLACGLAPSFEVLLVARSVQAVGGALVITAALDLLSETEESAVRAIRVWVVAGVLGAAVGPAIGGVLTQTLGWEWIFLAQTPLILVPLAALGGFAARPLPAPAGRPRLGANLGLMLLSGGLVAALFLLVLLLVDGWGLPPALAGLVVTVMPLAAIAAGRLGARLGSAVLRTAVGVVLVAGGLAALAVLPDAGWGWTVAPQVLVGAGIGLALAALTEEALLGRPEQVVQGGWTIAFRHAGVVVGLLLLAPVLTTTLERNKDEAVRAGAAAVLDSRIPPLEKLRVAQDVLVQVENAEGELPDVAAAFEDRPDTDEYRSLLAALEDQLERAVTDAFSDPFALAALLALAALVPLAVTLGRSRRTVVRARSLLVAAAGVVSLVLVYVALGGLSYAPAAVADPCRAREWRDPGGLAATLEQIALSTLDGAACELGVSREELVLALRDDAALDAFAAKHGIARADAEHAIREGLVRSVDDAEEAGALPGLVSGIVRGVAERLPPRLLLDLLDRLRGLVG
jgi:predicted MFS family arabinose efflux permease